MQETSSINEEIVSLLPRLRRFALSLAGNMDDADDLVQATVEKAIRGSGGWKPGTKLDSWLYRIMQNQWIDQYRKQKVRGIAVDIDDVHDLASDDGRRTTENRLALRDVRAAIMTLPETQRAVVMLALVEGLSYRETAEILDVTEGTVMSRLSRARSTLRAKIRAEEEA